MNWNAFTPLEATVGGVLIGLSAVWMLAAHGRIAGISGIFGSLLGGERFDWHWRAAFILGLISAGLVGLLLSPHVFDPGIVRSLPVTIAAGLLVGFGTRLGSGCTSGHGICGIGRLSPRSLVATGLFMASGALTVWLFRIFGGA